ncbi:16S rRNA (adenine(1518)-N(6)/adenine(1519)-N(6))-dimethyltransferase RsmA [Psychrobacter sp. LV10R520-6]|uniref:16S rRNA (adenine(1518)-N(6)/adenine(1519)-N(6))- dimethyltransferase RsmA n=1 Tax=Psychrobacter sp. LV10R520-6 TaxID=1415574 RepID=UPI0024C8B318|nr:16S rRNA (adenine(1518)-N(6)/adenine(1519)-N(6))-dimethyltransferase RsmA [Psychrobacter sp. LV10R520-6]SNT69745.1 dimethyladenosine transferase [Psychrobacter sp. LV10R520-6]
MSKPSFDAETLSASLRAAKHQPRKRFGQNFLHDRSVIREIVDSIHLSRDENLIEIGPGMGALTEPLLAEVDAMTVIELDRDLADSLRIRIGANSHPNFTIIKANAMSVDYRELYTPERGKLRVVGNLPYNISTPILFHLLSYADVIQDMHFMLQKEVVERITADVGSKIYGRLSVIMQYHCDTDYLLTVPRGAFNPPPKVTSAVFRLTPHIDKPIVAEDEQHFALIVRETFNHRRKTLRAIFKKSTLLSTLSEDDFAACNIDPQARPETLSVSDFVNLSNHARHLEVES